MTEQEFVDSFDAKFPYLDKETATALIHQGWAISPNAAFCVLHEICRPPHGTDVDVVSQHCLTNQWSEAGDHSLKKLLLGCAASLIDDVPMPWPEALKVIEQIDRFDGQYAALSVACFAGDSSTIEGDEALEKSSTAIRKRWDA